MSADAVFLSQCLGTLLPVRLRLIDLKNALFAARIPGTMAAQFMLDLSLR